MGRKIPGKKHRGIKDPFAQQAKRLESIKTKINRAPIDPDEQPVPKSLIHLMSWKNKNKHKIEKKKDKIGNPSNSLKFAKKKDVKVNSNNPVNKLKKIPGESNKSFNIRINEAMTSLKYEKTFDDIIYDTPSEKEKKMMDTDSPKVFIHKKGKKKRKIDVGEPFLTKSQKRTLKEKMKKERLKQEREMDQMYVVKKDDIKFGEIVHEPPSLHIKPRKAEKAATVPRPARKDLLLNKLFDKKLQNTQNSVKMKKPNITINSKKTDGILDMKGKRKDLPQNVRRKLEESQKEAIEAYRLLKLEKMKKKS